MGYQDIFLAITDSTNRVAKELGETGGVHGSGVFANAQTAGRGRLGREWFSPPGKNLYCSYLVRPDIGPEEYPKLTMVAGVAAVVRFVLQIRQPQKEIRLKAVLMQFLCGENMPE